MLFLLSKMRKKNPYRTFFCKLARFFFLMYTSITFRTRVGRPKIRFGLVFCIFCTQKNISMCHPKIPFLEYISDFFSQKTYRDFFFLMYTSITFRTRVNIIKTSFWAKWQKFLLIRLLKIHLFSSDVSSKMTFFNIHIHIQNSESVSTTFFFDVHIGQNSQKCKKSLFSKIAHLN